METCPMFDRLGLQLARLYLEFGNPRDALAELDSLSPSVRALPPVAALREQCRNMTVEQWRLRVEAANELVERFPGYAVARALHSFCLRQFAASC